MVSSASGSGELRRTPWFRRVGSNPVLAAFVLLAVTIAAHWPAVHADILWDDIVQITDNTTLHGPDALWRIWFEPKASPNYYPLLFTTFWFDYRLTNLNLAIAHGVNILLQALCGLVLWRVLKRLGVHGAWFAAALFAVHPVTVESVAWLIERKNTLSLLLFLLSALMLLRMEGAQKTHAGIWRAAFTPWPAYCAALVLFAAALFAKTSVIMLPPLLLLSAWWRRGRVTWADMLRAAPLFVMAAVLGYVTVWHESTSYFLTAEQDPRPEGPLSCLAASGWCLWFYLYKLVLPVRLSMLYPRWDVDPTSVLSWLPLAGLLVVAVAAWCRRQTWGRPLLVAMIAWVVMLLPVLGISDIGLFHYSLVTDHWQHPAMWLPLALAAATGARLFGRSPWASACKVVAAVVLLCVCSALTWSRANVYDSAVAVWADAAEKHPAGWGPRYLLGLSQVGVNDLNAAIGNLHMANELRPDDVPILCNLGGALVRQQKYDEAVLYLHRAVVLAPGSPEANFNLGIALQSLGRIDEAIAAYRNALARGTARGRIAPTKIAVAHVRLAVALQTRGDIDEAIDQCRTALSIVPDLDMARRVLASLRVERGSIE